MTDTLKTASIVFLYLNSALIIVNFLFIYTVKKWMDAVTNTLKAQRQIMDILIEGKK